MGKDDNNYDVNGNEGVINSNDDDGDVPDLIMIITMYLTMTKTLHQGGRSGRAVSKVI